jgi:energy-coupling factor transport system ATP-binding protein
MEDMNLKVVLDNVDVKLGTFCLTANGDFPEGIHLVSGAVGTGKSTLALIIAGLFLLEKGSISRYDIDTMMLSLQFPEYHITGMTLSEECASWGCYPEKIFSLPEYHGKQHQSPFSLSRGELKYFHLTCILDKEYDLLLLDEPFSSLDCENKLKLCDNLSKRVKGITIIFTHEQAILPRVNRIWEIIDGVLYDRGILPYAISQWRGAPILLKSLVAKGKTPNNISYMDMLEATCRT